MASVFPGAWWTSYNHCIRWLGRAHCRRGGNATYPPMVVWRREGDPMTGKWIVLFGERCLSADVELYSGSVDFPPAPKAAATATARSRPMPVGRSQLTPVAEGSCHAPLRCRSAPVGYAVSGRLGDGRRRPARAKSTSPTPASRTATGSLHPGIAAKTASATFASAWPPKPSNAILGLTRKWRSWQRRISSSPAPGASSPTAPSSSARGSTIG